MTAQLAQKISNYLCSVRLHNINGGTQANFVINFAEQARLYDETSTEPYTSQQRFSSYKPPCLEPNLSQVLTLHNTATKAAGVKSTYTFEEYVASLLDQAAVHDSASTSTGGRNPRPARSVNVMELCFDDGMIGQDDHNG
jgi:hypothetical protein